MTIFVGTAGWAIGTAAAPSFPADGSSLERYASVFSAVEINSSFHRPHRAATWHRWREAVPDHFQFSVKLPKTISHEQKLVGCKDAVSLFLDQVHELGDKLAVLLLQLPPKLIFDARIAEHFLADLQSRCSTPIVCEPRHSSWFSEDADGLMRAMGVARVAADPARHPDAPVPGGWRGLSYYRLHGSPIMYRSSYADRIADYAEQVQGQGGKGQSTWCIFDNTASSAAVSDALRLISFLRGKEITDGRAA